MLHLPTDSQVQSKNPHLTIQDDDWKPVSQLLLHFSKFQLAPIRQESSATPVSRPVPNSKPTKVPAVGIEARIRELSGAELVRVSALNKIKTEPHPTNAGITAMRRKNALLAAHRNGTQIKL